MEDSASNENPSKDFNKIDLTQLHGFSFGTQWTHDKNAREPRRDDRPGREGDNREGGAGEARRDRRNFRKPAGGPSAPSGENAPSSGAPAGDNRAPQRDFRGGPRRDGPGGGDRGNRSGGGRFPSRDSAPVERGPYLSPFFNVTFYPEDVGFTALAKAIRTSCRTYELFEIARVIIGKNDRFVAVLQRKPSENFSGTGAAAPSEPQGKVAPLAISLPDGVPFETEEAAIGHVLGKHLGQFFDAAEVEVEAPKGNFQVVNKCTVTGELLGPPNYHRYNQIVQQHFASRIARMPFEVYKSRIESVRDPEAINQWLEKMKKTTRYTWKLSAEGEAPSVFDSLEDARGFLLSKSRDKVVKAVDAARFHGKNVELLPPGEIKRTLEGALERQRRFPLDTANALRGRLRREGFTIFKKGSKGVSYVCAVKRKFRVPGQTFSDSIGSLINFIEVNPMVKASELPVKFLGIQAPATPESAAPAAGVTTSPIPTDGSIPPMATQAATALTPADQAKMSRLSSDLRWLVTEGYVTEFIDGRLFAPPAVSEARKHEVEKDEHDPENFPEVPTNSVAPEARKDIASTKDAADSDSSVEASAPVEDSAGTVTAPPMVADPAASDGSNAIEPEGSSSPAV